MKVTGWTYFENPNYIDIALEITKIRCEVTKDIKPRIPTYKEVEELRLKEADPETKLENILKEHRKAFDDALLKVKQKTDELEKIEEEIEKAVIEELRAHNYHFPGYYHQNADFGSPIIDDKYIFCTTQRRWGGIMAKAFPEEIDNSDGMGYLEWAWENNHTKVYPKEE